MASSNGLTDITLGTDLNLDQLYKKLKELDLIDYKVLSQRIENTHKKLSINADVNEPYFDRSLPFGLIANHEETLSSLTRVVDDYRVLLRKNINALSNSSVIPFSILDMPDEILVKICGYVKGWEPDPNTSTLHSAHHIGTKEVQNLRLSCKRLCATSSHLLLHFVTIDFTTSASIRRLHEISLHPAISRGVRTVRVILSFYDSKLAASFPEFVGYNAKKLSESADGVEEMARYDEELAGYRDQGCSQRISQRKIVQTRSILNIGTQIEDEDLSNEGQSYRNALIRGYEEYQKLFEEQEKRLADGSFIESVAAAIARMPLATRLEIHDYRRFDQRCLDSTLPVAIHKAGTSLTSLDIQSLLPGEHFSLVPWDKDLKELTAAMQRLKTFQFVPLQTRDQTHRLIRQSGELNCLKSFISAILDSPSLETISLNLRELWDNNTFPAQGLFSLLHLRPWPKLSWVSLRSTPLRLEEMAEILHSSDTPIRFWGRSLHLQDGSWADGLDLLKRKATNESTLDRPTGAECDTMSKDELDNIFQVSGDNWPLNKAELYIRGYSVKNPLRHDETTSENEAGV
ncbi:hypothetical protein BKA65DRAFT_600519 [Rhexocercosporidium sp. MPI-PUGE-AT-0058]|nr:hypothetical protein BKA65DRAFT_600519 [Rhexocercosporidium sp. MPI-PUGE-AT-0058]